MTEEEVYEKLLDAFDKDGKVFDKEMEKNHPTKAKYYLQNIEDNLYDKPHDKFDNRAKAIYSSAAMIYNLFGNKVVLNGKKYDVIYEQELPAIIPGKGKYETHKAHLDATLSNKDEIIFCEAKLKEWLGSPKRLAEAYLKTECYLPITDKKEKFIEFFNKIIDLDSLNKDRTYKSKYKRYDAIQMIIHMLGIYNELKSNDTNIKKVKLINCVWGHDSIKQYLTEKQEADEFISLANKEVKDIFKDIDFSIEYYEFHELKKLIDFKNDKKREEYLKRYDIF